MKDNWKLVKFFSSIISLIGFERSLNISGEILIRKMRVILI